MTKEERRKAIRVLDSMKVKIDIPKAAVMQNDKNWALDIAINELKQEPKTEWVSISERLPKINQPVYVTYKWHNKHIFCPIPCYLSDNGLWYTDRNSLINEVNLDDYDDGTDQPFVCDIEAWRPLPKPYNEK